MIMSETIMSDNDDEKIMKSIEAYLEISEFMRKHRLTSRQKNWLTGIYRNSPKYHTATYTPRGEELRNSENNPSLPFGLSSKQRKTFYQLKTSSFVERLRMVSYLTQDYYEFMNTGEYQQYLRFSLCKLKLYLTIYSDGSIDIATYDSYSNEKDFIHCEFKRGGIKKYVKEVIVLMNELL